MKTISLTGKHKVVALNSLRMNQEGFKGIDRIRTGLRVMKKLEAGFPREGEVPKEILTQEFKIEFEDVEFNLLKGSLESLPWNGNALEIVNELFDIMEAAK